MKYLKSLDSFDKHITEKRVTVKRRYTENHPAKSISTAARVRNSVIEAMGDGVLTEEELIKILQELKAHKRWLSRNTKLFNISEDQNGIKSYTLSPFGKRVKSKTVAVNEAKARSKSPSDMITVVIDLAGDDKDIMDVIKKYKLKADWNGATPNSADLTGKKKDILDYLQSDYYGLDARDIRDMFPELLESEINEEYVESMDSIEIANALGKIKTLWDRWKSGPMTEPSDIKPAQKELKGWLDSWFKQNIK